MILPVNGSTQQYLDDLSRIQSAAESVQRQLSSGVRVATASDDPSALPGILKNLAQIAQDTGLQTDLNQVTTELSSGDAALQQATRLMDQAVSLATQAANATDSTAFASIAAQVQGIQQQMVSLTATQASGRYIFGGDLEQSAPYAYDASQTNGVRALTDPTSTRVVLDRAGSTIWTPKTAQEVFDARDASGSATAGNVFASLGRLMTALGNNDAAGAAFAIGSLKTATGHLDQQLGFYGIAETRVSDVSDQASRAVVTGKRDLSAARDADAVAGALQLSQLNLQQEAALAVGAKRLQDSLFSYLA
jgi:flagellar hook-associated protein 3 FlgL